MSFEKIVPPFFDPVEKRREAMTDILASWDLEGAMPDVTGLQVVRDYVVGRLDLTSALVKVSERAAQLRAKERHSAL
ncbi:hypothetical protein [Arthrobacter sp. EpRS71]|uniref:hypothetical protein n=1 Tax=Arthrobacter sp. EpRS71 TaxID=1743141 RepID=UPI000746AA2B|nr:hypothetical protein [Arthrobacter sp. EpRS71]KUM35513.1 hypothetical protein AR689_15960 [Arthrobacter sp. EpRS71]